jgi:uncharacterized membrane protein YkvA (DUF1232 family)
MERNNKKGFIKSILSMFFSAPAKIAAALRMVKAYLKGDYKVVPYDAIITVFVVAIYVIVPLDLIPDFLPIIGFGDDAALGLWALNKVDKAITAFIDWEKLSKPLSQNKLNKY